MELIKLKVIIVWDNRRVNIAYDSTKTVEQLKESIIKNFDIPEEKSFCITKRTESDSSMYEKANFVFMYLYN